MAQLALTPGLGSRSLEGVTVEYGYWPGDPRRPLLVLLHEGLGCVALWRDFPAALAAATGCGVFAYSRVGYGGSSPCMLPRPLSYMEDEAQGFLPKLLAQLPASALVPIGHSDGGSIAAVNAGAMPDVRLRGVVLIAPHFFTEPEGLASIAAVRRSYREGDLRRRLVRYHGDNVDCAFHGWAESWLHPDFKQWDLTPFLPQIAVPTLLIQGEDDEYGTAAQLQTAERLIPAPVQSHVLAACGHSPHREQPDALCALIAAFIGRLHSSAGGVAAVRSGNSI